MAIDFTISKATNNDSLSLTNISFAAKKHWNYPNEYYKIWENELTISQEYISSNIVFKVLLNNNIIGFYSIVEVPNDFTTGNVFVQKGYWLEHMFIHPHFHTKGIGSSLINHVKSQMNKIGIAELFIFVDPFAKGFYDKVGATFIKNSKSSIPNRAIPIYKLEI